MICFNLKTKLMHKCLNLYYRLSLCILIAITTLVLNSDGAYSSQDMVSTTWCLNQVEKVSKQNDSCRSELSKTTADLQREKSKKNTVVERLGILAIGSGLALTNFNPLGCVIAGYLILFQ